MENKICISGIEAAKILRDGQPLENYIVDGNIKILNETISNPIIIKKSTIQGNFIFSNRINARNTVNGALFQKKVEINDTTIEGEAIFVGSEFQASLCIYKCIFKDTALFSSCVFKRDAIFDSCQFNAQASFNARFKGDANFCETKFSSADFEGAIFESYASFTGSDFASHTNFLNAKFESMLEFKNATFNCPSSFYGTIFSGEEMTFEGTEFNEDCHFHFCKFKCDEVNFKRTTYHGETEFNESVFYGKAYFEESRFEGDTSFIQASFNDNVFFEKTEFNGNLNLYLSSFNKFLDFTDVTFSLVSFESISFNKELVNLKWAQVAKKVFCTSSNDQHQKKYAIRDQYLFLSNLFKNRGQYEDFDKAYYECKRLSAKLTDKKHLFNRLWNYLQDILFGYGTSPWRILIWSVIVILVFSFIYFLSCMTGTGCFEQSKVLCCIQKMWFSVLFSIGSFTSAGTTGLNPIGAWSIFSIIESVLGYVFMALFIVTLCNKMLR